MRRVVFYSWQSDHPNNIGRGFINDCIEKALKSIRGDDTLNLYPIIDRDTAGLHGSPHISDSIFSKISTADIFIADVTNIYSGDGRKFPNPNVLIELGYAISELGWEQIILVQNAEFGTPETLPFDLRGRRVLNYKLKEGEDKSEVRGFLCGCLASSVKDMLLGGAESGLLTGRGVNLWLGEWTLEAVGQGGLKIREASPGGFLFDLNVFYGAHIGQVTAYARIISKDLAYCRLPQQDQDGEIMFRRKMVDGRRVIQIEEQSSCHEYRGIRAYFSGSYTRKRDPWFDSGELNELDVARLYNLLGENIEELLSVTLEIKAHESLDDQTQAKVITGGVPGLYTISESIVLCGRKGGLWVSYFIDGTLKYFTNVPKYIDDIPSTIREWSKRFEVKNIINCPPVLIIPEEDS